MLFNDGIAREVDLKKLVSKGVFSAWKSVEFFNSVHIDKKSDTVTWREDLDLDPYVLHNQVDSLLDLKSELYIKQSPQKTDNCTIATSHSMELIILFALLHPTFVSKNAFLMASAIKNARREDTRIDDLKNYLTLHDPHGKNDLWPVNMNLINQIYDKYSKSNSKKAAKIRYLIDEWKCAPYTSKVVTD